MEENFYRRAKSRAVQIADQCLDEEGKLKKVIAPELEPIFQNEVLIATIEQFGLPLFDPTLERLIQIDLGLERPLENRDVVWAVLSALLCPLRQRIGSCFGTAPAILVHDEQPAQFLEDMRSLLTMGQLERVIGGREYVVPMSPSPGLGGLKLPREDGTTELEEMRKEFLEKFELKESDFQLARNRSNPKLHAIEEMEHDFKLARWRRVAKEDHLLLRIWEYTIASFVDVKTEFSTWNLHSSLGLHPDERGGIGEFIFQALEKKLAEANEKTQELHQECEIAFDQVRATEHLMRNAATEREIRRLKSEHTSRLYHLRSCEEAREDSSQKAHHIADFFPFLIESIIEKFQEYFQEIYDAEMQEIKGSIYDDSPAGFRLLYKHGRRHVGSWTFIHNKEEYIQALVDFFRAIEYPLIDLCEWEGGKEKIPYLITSIIHLISSETFLISAFVRLAKAHRVPLQKITLDDLDKMEKKPWSYTSGGTLPTLLKTYFRREGSLSEEARWVASPQDLLIFLLETMKMLPPKITDSFIEDPMKRMLMTSPTHVFSLLPGQPLFRKGWEDPGFTYTFVRDQLIIPGQEFYKKIRLTPNEQIDLVRELASRMPLLQGHDLERGFSTNGKPITIQAFAKKVSHPMLDALLFEKLPKPITCLFADTNWEQLYFTFAVNPITLELDLWRTDADISFGMPMKEWAPYLDGTLRKNWSVFLRPYEYLS